MNDTTEKKASEKGMEQHFYRASAEDFGKIPGSPITYWVPNSISQSFDESALIGQNFEVRSGLTTGDNGLYIHFWHEVSNSHIIHGASKKMNFFSPHNKGGDFRKWYGNAENVLKYGADNIPLCQTSCRL